MIETLFTHVKKLGGSHYVLLPKNLTTQYHDQELVKITINRVSIVEEQDDSQSTTTAEHPQQ